ncbi:MAG: hypothetical protein PHO10_07720, partial [Gemmiger sp.]|nr:hypothetical protein [Gemmiger sp.]
LFGGQQPLPPLATPWAWWLLPLLAQQRGYTTKSVLSAGQLADSAAVLDTLLYQNQQPRPLARALGRAAKHTLKRRCHP